MTFALLFPAGLFALAALALPILIHLSRRTEQRITRFAALRWLDARIPPRSRIRIAEVLLLLLRLLLIAALALLLARPVFTGWPWATPTRVLVHPAVALAQARNAVPEAGADWRWLAPGFPGIDVPDNPQTVAVWSLLREADSMLPADTPLIVIVPESLAGLDGERPALARAVQWQVVPGGESGARTAADPDPIVVAIRYADPDDGAMRYLRAAIVAWNAREPGRFTADVAAMAAPLPPDARWLVWLGAPPSESIQRWIDAGGTALVVAAAPADSSVAWRNAHGAPLAHESSAGQGRLIRIASALEPKALPELLDAEFPDRLRALFEGPAADPDRAVAADARPLPARARPAALPSSVDPWLAPAIAILFLLERLAATRARRRYGS